VSFLFFFSMQTSHLFLACFLVPIGRVTLEKVMNLPVESGDSILIALDIYILYIIESCNCNTSKVIGLKLINRYFTHILSDCTSNRSTYPPPTHNTTNPVKFSCL
jgi:hypothetical protein